MEDLEKKIIEEAKRLIILNYSIDEIVYYLSKNYNLEPYLVREILVKNFSLIYRIFLSVEKKILILALFSFLFLSMVFNISPFSILFLLFLFYFIVILDYFAFTGKFNLNLSYFFVSILFFIFWIVSLFTFYNKFFPLAILPFLTIPFLVNKVLSKNDTGILRLTNSLVEFYKLNFNLLLFLSLLFLAFLFFHFLPFEYVLLILFFVFLVWIYFVRDKIIKIFSVLVFLIVIVKLFFWSNAILSKTVDNIKENYKAEINYKFFCPFYEKIEVEGLNINKKGEKSKNETLTLKYKNITLKLLKNQCSIQLNEFMPEFKSPFEFYLIISTYKSNCAKKIERELNKQLKEKMTEFSRFINKTDFDSKYYKRIISYLLNLNYYTCLNEFQK